jgi:hypothetical protein
MRLRESELIGLKWLMSPWTTFWVNGGSTRGRSTRRETTRNEFAQRCAADPATCQHGTGERGKTNAIEALNRQLRKAIKTKGHFPNEEAARKLIYLAITNAVPAWTRTRNWTTALLAFKIHFGDRLPE